MRRLKVGAGEDFVLSCALWFRYRRPNPRWHDVAGRIAEILPPVESSRFTPHIAPPSGAPKTETIGPVFQASEGDRVLL